MKRRTPPRRVDFFARSDDFAVALHGAMGRSTTFIARLTGLTPCQVQYRLSRAQIRRADYRNGTGSWRQWEHLTGRLTQAVTPAVRAALQARAGAPTPRGVVRARARTATRLLRAADRRAA